MNKILFKNVSELTDKEITEVNEACTREFHEPFTKSVKNEASSRQLFLLKDKSENIVSMGQLILIEPVRFMGQTYSILGVGGIVSNVKGKGYGKKIMATIKQYLMENHKTGIGFCGKHNRLFYEKCGFSVDPDLIHRFVYYTGNKKVVNHNDDCLVYFDSNGSFMKKIFADSSEEILLPRPPDW